MNSLFNRVGLWVSLNVVTIIIQQHLTKEGRKESRNCIHHGDGTRYTYKTHDVILQLCAARVSPTWYRMASQKGRRKGSAESTRKKPAGKSQGWVAVPDKPSWMVPRWKASKYPVEISILLTDENPVGGAVHKSTFYATVTSQDAVELSKCKGYSMQS